MTVDSDMTVRGDSQSGRYHSAGGGDPSIGTRAASPARHRPGRPRAGARALGLRRRAEGCARRDGGNATRTAVIDSGGGGGFRRRQKRHRSILRAARGRAAVMTVVSKPTPNRNDITQISMAIFAVDGPMEGRCARVLTHDGSLERTRPAGSSCCAFYRYITADRYMILRSARGRAAVV